MRMIVVKNGELSCIKFENRTSSRLCLFSTKIFNAVKCINS